MSAYISVYDAFLGACSKWGDAPFIGGTSRLTHMAQDLTFGDVAKLVDERIGVLRQAGYGAANRVALLLGNRPEHFVYLLACNALGMSIVPLNPDLTTPELAYVLSHSEAGLVICSDEYREQALAAAAAMDVPVPIAELHCAALPPALQRSSPGSVMLSTEASLLYTSGTTGKPKGCIISNEYYLYLGVFYAGCGGLVDVRPGSERILNPLPLFHQNAGIFSFMGAMLSGSCIIMTDRFHASTWWQEVVETRATIIHYLGVMPAILLKLPFAELEARHHVRFGVGAGVEPTQHGLFEDRFGFPLLELWGMTETGGGFMIDTEPRQVGTRAVGRPRGVSGRDLEIRLVDESGNDVQQGAIGELLVRRSGPDPGRGLFSGYLKDPSATDEAWKGGWFHTGDAFWQDDTGMLHFAERKKNIIRRSGENIAAMEIEATLQAHPKVLRVAVMAVHDEVRGEEVLACVVHAVESSPEGALADELFQWCIERLAYYKAPGWMVFLEDLPSTSTQKVQKTRIFPAGIDPRHHPRAFDLRDRKKRVVR
ncbi:AMP-binding protein [Pusillimonas sp. SM2304]|uniref:AMP-binding protein n=1 Tax=Pusillimonas sp. SM2304 TaxID=3073241 RepID=UPI0038F77A20